MNKWFWIFSGIAVAYLAAAGVVFYIGATSNETLTQAFGFGVSGNFCWNAGKSAHAAFIEHKDPMP